MIALQEILDKIKPFVIAWTTPPSGFYTPTLTNVTNVAASTAYECQWARVGGLVTVSGQVAIDPTAAGACVIRFSLPIASTFTFNRQLAGTAYSDASLPAGIRGSTTTYEAVLFFVATASTLANQTFFFHITYKVV